MTIKLERSTMQYSTLRVKVMHSKLMATWNTLFSMNGEARLQLQSYWRHMSVHSQVSTTDKIFLCKIIQTAALKLHKAMSNFSAKRISLKQSLFCSDPVVNSSIGLLFEKILLQGEKARTRMEEPRLEDPRIGWRRTGESRSSSGRRARKERWKDLQHSPFH